LLFYTYFYKIEQNIKDGTRGSVTVLCVVVWCSLPLE